MNKTIGLFLLLVGGASLAYGPVAAPEIDPSAGANAVALLAGAFLVIRGRKK